MPMCGGDARLLPGGAVEANAGRSDPRREESVEDGGHRAARPLLIDICMICMCAHGRPMRGSVNGCDQMMGRYGK